MASLNKYMHPRNIYRTAPDFKAMAIKYPQFRKYAKQELSGKMTVDFKDPEALRTVTCCLLHKDFGLEVDIPADYLVPTLPLRLNYILWLEDLLTKLPGVSTVRGIDIGTGASCIFPLLAARTKNWHMLATEIDESSIQYAQSNVIANSLSSLITVRQVPPNTILLGALLDADDGLFSFTMCNPPFFGSTRETDSESKCREGGKRHPPRNARTGITNEVVTDGGEVQFVQRMVEESKELASRVGFFTTMVGHKSSLPPLKKAIRESGACHMTEAHFCQGHTMRWGLAWTFQPEVNLEAAPILRKKKEKPPLVFPVPKWAPTVKKYTVPIIMKKVRQCLQGLGVECETLKCNKSNAVVKFTAWENTWSHQRRKRREKMRLETLQRSTEEEPQKEANEQMETSSPASEEGGPSPHGTKRVRSDSEDEDVDEIEEEVPKRLKLSSGDDVDSGVCASEFSYESESEKDSMERECVLKCNVVVRRSSGNVLLELFWLDGSEGRDSMHRVLQHLKNKLTEGGPPPAVDAETEPSSSTMDVGQ